MKKIKLNDLPKWTQWPDRLLGLSEWKAAKRTIDKVKKEYDDGKYSEILEYYMSKDHPLSPEEVRIHEYSYYNLYPDTKICISRGENLFETDLNSARKLLYNFLRDVLSKCTKRVDHIFELGCGHGYNLWRLHKIAPNIKYTGGEFSENAVSLANHLYKSDPNLNVVRFNFYDQVYEILEALEKPAVIFTFHAVEQLPSAKHFLTVLSKYRDRIDRVYHFEPVYEFYDETLFGMMRRRYTQINDYNRDLLFELKSREDKIRIVDQKENVIGLNPLNPLSLIEWTFI
ncbi:MAG: class I SAM-dependent methyltransferase [Deltaproteobacteria bacterium]|uniref:Class I SAM-dependent methyltransferase n=1 Tax=Candidatus Zymogenus saltonus TaxID=2844893 RepID=A0A9D8KGT2_9DELT|nr:class I SAM-dependent methyltransferase [Candidatus Zymogenus saltonus]